MSADLEAKGRTVFSRLWNTIHDYKVCHSFSCYCFLKRNFLSLFFYDRIFHIIVVFLNATCIVAIETI